MKTPFAAGASTAQAPAVPVRFPYSWLLALFLATLGMWIGLLASAQILLPSQIESIDPANKVWLLGLVTGVAAAAAVVSSPVAGALSDRTTWRFGRRRSWVAAFSLLCTAALLALPWQSTVLGAGVCWIVVHASVSGMHVALCAAVPDRIPVHQRGMVSAVAGLAQPLGLVAGTLLVSSVDTATGYLLVAMLVPALTVPYALLAKDVPGSLEPSADRQSFRISLADLYVKPRQHPDFAWAWAGRFMAQLATSLATVYLLYFLRDKVRVADAAEGVAVLSLLFTSGLIVASLIAGRLSDRIGRRKVFVIVSSLLSATGLVTMALVPVWPAAMAAAAMLGAGYGVYFAIDQALVTELLPRARDRGKDLGVMNMAGSGAVALAPLIAANAVALGGYSALFILAASLAVAGGLFVWPVKAVS
ncbi:MFS transporter [Actinomadura rudentiformis]|uniref:MFS transporter n=1 Tax=Actinomadura rudentiformis TaxID=359158 RepID=A0A6H9Y7U7_9ACTN|nr:MFS transporter [Actinomadura rudentiformis]KAB2339994.1 MFS transporter [Actinomadura rudentiformis]